MGVENWSLIIVPLLSFLLLPLIFSVLELLGVYLLFMTANSTNLVLITRYYGETVCS